MKAKTIRIIGIVLIALTLVVAIANVALPVFAETTPNQLNAQDPQGNYINTIGERIIGILRAVGVVLSVVVLIVIGIKYMMGSPEEKSEYKTSMLPYIIGAALIFAASIFAQTIYDFFTGLGNN